jgi:hypothetical protein
VTVIAESLDDRLAFLGVVELSSQGCGRPALARAKTTYYSWSSLVLFLQHGQVLGRIGLSVPA